MMQEQLQVYRFDVKKITSSWSLLEIREVISITGRCHWPVADSVERYLPVPKLNLCTYKILLKSASVKTEETNQTMGVGTRQPTNHLLEQVKILFDYLLMAEI